MSKLPVSSTSFLSQQLSGKKKRSSKMVMRRMMTISIQILLPLRPPTFSTMEMLVMVKPHNKTVNLAQKRHNKQHSFFQLPYFYHFLNHCFIMFHPFSATGPFSSFQKCPLQPWPFSFDPVPLPSSAAKNLADTNSDISDSRSQRSPIRSKGGCVSHLMDLGVDQ